MKYRIIQKDEKFYPQVKSFIFWSSLVYSAYPINRVECNSYQEALEVLLEFKEKELRKPTETIVYQVDI